MPHPDGPMNAVTCLRKTSMLTPLIATSPEYATETSSSLSTTSRCASGIGVCCAASSPSLLWFWLATTSAVLSSLEDSALLTRSGSLTVDIS